LGNQNRGLNIIIAGIIVLIAAFFGSRMFNQTPQVFSGSAVRMGQETGGKEAASAVETEMPWDYKIDEGQVGDLIDGDMVVLPGNQLLPNDNRYQTGDKIWILSVTWAAADPGGQEGIKLSNWQAIKSYRSKAEADKDLQDLKVLLKTNVPLIGVYKTGYQGQIRQFAVIQLPTGQDVKTPISSERYERFKNMKEVSVLLEEVHDYENYDLAMSKFRGWGD
jgi:hypothetical protein